MQCCGVFDVEGTTVSTQGKLYQALHGIYLPHAVGQHSLLPTHFPSHLYHENTFPYEGMELVRLPHTGEGFADEYEKNHVYRAFPKVYQFGQGGFSDPGSKEKKLSWDRHMRWMLEQSHGKFSQHEVFMFVVFNILQRRKMCLGARLVTRRANLPLVATLLRGMDSISVHQAIASDINTGLIHTFSNSTLHQLMQSTAIANGLIRGSRQYIQNRRGEIRALFTRFGGPKFFITINPDDMRHPLVLSLRGDQSTEWHPTITNNFLRHHRARCQMIAENPSLQAQFFDIVFKAVIDVLFGFERDPKVGIFGEVVAYYAIIESQGKGTLHAHGLVWLKDGTESNFPTVF